MADTNFQPGTVIASSWLRDVNTNTYTILSAVAGTNTITGNASSTVTVGYPRGVAFRFLPVNNNTGAVTINISGLGVKNLTKLGAVPLQAGDLITGSWAYITYDGTQFQLINASGPLNGTDTYITTAGTTTAYTLPVSGSFGLFSGNAVKLIFNATNTTTTPTMNVAGTGAIAMKVMSSDGTKIDPVVGAFAINTPATAMYDGVNWLVIVEYPTGKLLNVQTFTANGTYTPTPGTTRIVVKGQGAGGAGGGAGASGGGQVIIGSGGGAGGIAESFFTTGFTPTVAVTIGAGGTGVAGANGNAGGASSFGALMTFSGGAGGLTGGLAAVSAAGQAAGGASTGGNIYSVPGNSSDQAIGSFASGGLVTGRGANSLYGSGGPSSVTGTGTNSFSGQAATGRGAGGGGSVTVASGAVATGGTGTGGIIIVYEYS